MNFSLSFLSTGDWLSNSVAFVLLLMSVASWVVILSQGFLLIRFKTDLQHSIAAFWQARSWKQARLKVEPLDRYGLLLPLLNNLSDTASVGTSANAGTSIPFAEQGNAEQRNLRVLRDGLQTIHNKLHMGLTWLATVGSTAPFVGLLGTVWGIYHALMSIAATSGQMTMDKVAGPVGEALVMTAAGLAVALPAVLAYNAFNRMAKRLEARAEAFAHDLHQLAGSIPSTPVSTEASKGETPSSLNPV
jgi:biopolymer transport protein ExbB